MRLTEYTDYTLRVLIYLGLHREKVVTIQEIADAYGISKNHLMKIVHQLGLQGIVETTRGRGGGLRLKRSPESIRVGDIVRATEADFSLVECFDRAANQCVIAPSCKLKTALAEALEAFFRVLDDYTLSDFLQSEKRLVKLLQSRVSAVPVVMRRRASI
jgi:Rrf2 family nitric oxide-sensitive transcriptional repressor